MREVALIHDTAPFWNGLSGNGFGDIVHDLGAIHRSPLLLKVGDKSRLCRQVLDHDLVAEVGDDGDHKVVKPGADESVALMHECRADGESCHDFLLIVLHLVSCGPIVVAHLGHGVVVCNITCIVTWLIGQNAISTEADIWSVVVLVEWWQLALEAWRALAPWIWSSHIVLVGCIRLPVLVNTFPSSNLRLVERGIVILMEALNKFIVVGLIVFSLLTDEVLRHIIQCIFHIIVEVIGAHDGGYHH